MASARNSRNLIWSGLWIYSVATGLASMIFMAWAFYVETTGRGALFIEPNRVLAAGEIAPGAARVLGLFFFFFLRPRPPRRLFPRGFFFFKIALPRVFFFFVFFPR